MTTLSEQPKSSTWVQQHLPEIGLGGVAIGNEFEYVSDEQAQQTLTAAWQAGVRYYDVLHGTDWAWQKEDTDIFCITRKGKTTSSHLK